MMAMMERVTNHQVRRINAGPLKCALNSLTFLRYPACHVATAGSVDARVVLALHESGGIVKLLAAMSGSEWIARRKLPQDASEALATLLKLRPSAMSLAVEQGACTTLVTTMDHYDGAVSSYAARAAWLKMPSSALGAVTHRAMLDVCVSVLAMPNAPRELHDAAASKLVAEPESELRADYLMRWCRMLEQVDSDSAALCASTLRRVERGGFYKMKPAYELLVNALSTDNPLVAVDVANALGEYVYSWCSAEKGYDGVFILASGIVPALLEQLQSRKAIDHADHARPLLQTLEWCAYSDSGQDELMKAKAMSLLLQVTEARDDDNAYHAALTLARLATHEDARAELTELVQRARSERSVRLVDVACYKQGIRALSEPLLTYVQSELAAPGGALSWGLTEILATIASDGTQELRHGIFEAGAVESLLGALDSDTLGLAWRALALLMSQMDEGITTHSSDRTITCHLPACST